MVKKIEKSYVFSHIKIAATAACYRGATSHRFKHSF